MPIISGTLTTNDPYIPNIMLDVPNGLLLTDPPAGAGMEVFATNVQTRYVVDWSAVNQRVTHTRCQVVAKHNRAGAVVKVKMRDVTNGRDVDIAEVTSQTTALAAGPWRPFDQPRTGDVIYAVFVEGDGIADPTLYSVLWEWRGPNLNE